MIKEGIAPRLRESIELALKLGEGLCTVSRIVNDTTVDRNFSEQFVCPDTGESFSPLEPRSFSFNSPYGACPQCHGLGVMANDEEPDEEQLDGPVCPVCGGERLNAFSRGVTLAGRRLPELLNESVSAAAVWCQQLCDATQTLMVGSKEGTGSRAVTDLPEAGFSI